MLHGCISKWDFQKENLFSSIKDLFYHQIIFYQNFKIFISIYSIQFSTDKKLINFCLIHPIANRGILIIDNINYGFLTFN